jgi:PAS domain S-box-containing protein
MDITERKQAEEQLRLSEEKFATAFRVSPDAVNLTRTTDGKYIEINEGFTKITGYTAEETVGRSALELNIWVDPRDRARLVQELNDNGIVRDLEAEFRRKNGSTLTGHMSACLITFGGETCILSITRDITDRIAIQNERLKMQKLESLGVLAGGIAHDFNNILTGIMGNISFARRFLDSSHRASPVLLEAEKASQRATDLAHQLLTFAKGGEPVKKSAAAEQLVAASASFVLRGSNVHSRITIPDNLYALEVDEGQINQAFNNIIINAAQAMPNGGTINISGENVTLAQDNAVGLSAGNYVNVTFTDTGCGMSEETVKRIFDPYFTTKAGGTGLGLASAYSIITRHGGHIGVSSTPGQGSTFSILLPAGNAVPQQARMDTEAAQANRHEGKAVLVMDDEEMIRDLASEMLQEMGFHVWTCSNGDEAINLYKSAHGSETPFLAVIMDLTIPAGKGGKEAAREILDVDPQARLIVSSGYSNDPVMADHARYGFTSAITKPYTFLQLASVLEKLP